MTSFSLVYDSFLSKITDDMYLQLTQLDTYRMLEELLLSAIEKFEFPRQDLTDYQINTVADERIYNGPQTNYEDSLAIVYEDGQFNATLTHEQINILAVYMIVEWLSQQLASVENTRMKYSGSDFHFTSQANHMQKILEMKKDYQREGFHLQRLYKRRIKDAAGIMRSTFGTIMQPIGVIITDEYDVSQYIDYNKIRNKPQIESNVLIGNKTFAELDLTDITDEEIDDLISD